MLGYVGVAYIEATVRFLPAQWNCRENVLALYLELIGILRHLGCQTGEYTFPSVCPAAIDLHEKTCKGLR